MDLSQLILSHSLENNRTTFDAESAPREDDPRTTQTSHAVWHAAKRIISAARGLWFARRPKLARTRPAR